MHVVAVHNKPFVLRKSVAPQEVRGGSLNSFKVKLTGCWRGIVYIYKHIQDVKIKTESRLVRVCVCACDGKSVAAT